MSARGRDWNYHGEVTAHVIPDYRTGGATKQQHRASTSGSRSASSSRVSVADGGSNISRSSSRYGQQAAPQPPPQAAGSPSRAPLSDSQAALYAALFGVQPPGRAGGSSACASPQRGGGSTPTKSSEPSRADDEYSLPTNEQAKQIERAVRKAMRGAAIERQQAVDAALSSQRAKHEGELQASLARLDDEREAAAAEATRRAEEVAGKERERLHREAARERQAAISRAVDASEKAREVQWRKELEQLGAEAEARVETVTREKEAAIRKVRCGRASRARPPPSRRPCTALAQPLHAAAVAQLSRRLL